MKGSWQLLLSSHYHHIPSEGVELHEIGRYYRNSVHTCKSFYIDCHYEICGHINYSRVVRCYSVFCGKRNMLIYSYNFLNIICIVLLKFKNNS